MDQPVLRRLIQDKLADGRLPRDPFPSIRSRQGNGETCDGCEGTVTSAQMLMEILDARGCRVQLHVACYYVWDAERPGVRTQAKRPSSRPLRVQRPRRPSGPAMGAHRAARPATQFRVPMTLECGTATEVAREPFGRAGASIAGMRPTADAGALIITFPRAWTAAQRLAFMADVARAVPRERWAHVGERMCTDSMTRCIGAPGGLRTVDGSAGVRGGRAGCGDPRVDGINAKRRRVAR